MYTRRCISTPPRERTNGHADERRCLGAYSNSLKAARIVAESAGISSWIRVATRWCAEEKQTWDERKGAPACERSFHLALCRMGRPC